LGILCFYRSLGRNFIFITAKLLQLSRITNADGRYSAAPMAQMQC